ncbi:hypothetical protein CDD83_4613 [Cordyceps sp. RAO-2017]|nr:hypothetical protein CDD83_4613 [Cordyceps sp. RAO-2017]
MPSKPVEPAPSCSGVFSPPSRADLVSLRARMLRISLAMWSSWAGARGVRMGVLVLMVEYELTRPLVASFSLWRATVLAASPILPILMISSSSPSPTWGAGSLRARRLLLCSASRSFCIWPALMAAFCESDRPSLSFLRRLRSPSSSPSPLRFVASCCLRGSKAWRCSSLRACSSAVS